MLLSWSTSFEIAFWDHGRIIVKPKKFKKQAVKTTAPSKSLLKPPLTTGTAACEGNEGGGQLGDQGASATGFKEDPLPLWAPMLWSWSTYSFDISTASHSICLHVILSSPGPGRVRKICVRVVTLSSFSKPKMLSIPPPSSWLIAFEAVAEKEEDKDTVGDTGKSPESGDTAGAARARIHGVLFTAISEVVGMRICEDLETEGPDVPVDIRFCKEAFDGEGGGCPSNPFLEKYVVERLSAAAEQHGNPPLLVRADDLFVPTTQISSTPGRKSETVEMGSWLPDSIYLFLRISFFGMHESIIAKVNMQPRKTTSPSKSLFKPPLTTDTAPCEGNEGGGHLWDEQLRKGVSGTYDDHSAPIAEVGPFA
ncbi:hypothetical protein BDK51DRAFT_31989 [Blyttiomyces helicus]|uniref:Uncharacterized protein n=1 Tax=Blyttiomyces helicus TaxID=388810 RepID=A0A4P9W6J5_9FUNG|nr:hypothetical protein BDK51DRAFT_31989 [Blyttiomyces helicus]|eukprot:RKO87944.1 hypothetical protein BDK51DRAFT_31989 [Blyttiomyces helicus]